MRPNMLDRLSPVHKIQTACRPAQKLAPVDQRKKMSRVDRELASCLGELCLVGAGGAVQCEGRRRENGRAQEH